MKKNVNNYVKNWTDFIDFMIKLGGSESLVGLHSWALTFVQGTTVTRRVEGMSSFFENYHCQLTCIHIIYLTWETSKSDNDHNHAPSPSRR